MLYPTPGKVFIYNENKADLSTFDDFFVNHSLQTFASDNLYHIIKYAREITPDIMIFSIQDKLEKNFSPVIHFEEAIKAQCPIIVIRNDNIPFKIYSSVAHYLRLPRDSEKFTDITESYSLGGKNHQVMLLGSYCENSTILKQQLDSDNIPYFEVHNEIAAEIYLRKNTPQTIFIENTEAYKIARFRLRGNHTFYVDRQQDITEIKKFLN